MEKLQKISNYIQIALKSNSIVIGSENLSNVNKKLYLIIKEKSGQNSEKIALRISEKTGAEIIEVEQTVIEQLTHIKNCKVVAIKNKGIADKIKLLFKE